MVTANVTLALVVPLLLIEAVIPVGNPLIVPIVHAVLVVPTYPNTLVATLVATALPLLLAANVWFSFPSIIFTLFVSWTVGNQVVALFPTSILKSLIYKISPTFQLLP